MVALISPLVLSVMPVLNEKVAPEDATPTSHPNSTVLS